MHILFGQTFPAIFIKRLNRFAGLVDLDGRQVKVHIPTSGRLGELLVKGAAVRLKPGNSPGRRTEFSLLLVRMQNTWVSVDAQLANRLVGKALKNNEWLPFGDCRFVRSEPAFAGGRFDFLLAESGRDVYVEVKSVTLVEGETDLFPDAPTERGRRHLEKLAALAQKGCRCAVIFVAQREDAKYFAPVASGIRLSLWHCSGRRRSGWKFMLTAVL
jgi:sugar fermentation stimulation protein A